MDFPTDFNEDRASLVASFLKLSFSLAPLDFPIAMNADRTFLVACFLFCFFVIAFKGLPH